MTVSKFREILAGRAGSESIKVDGFDISHVSMEPEEGDLPGYVDITATSTVTLLSVILTEDPATIIMTPGEVQQMEDKLFNMSMKLKFLAASAYDTAVADDHNPAHGLYFILDEMSEQVARLSGSFPLH